MSLRTLRRVALRPTEQVLRGEIALQGARYASRRLELIQERAAGQFARLFLFVIPPFGELRRNQASLEPEPARRRSDETRRQPERAPLDARAVPEAILDRLARDGSPALAPPQTAASGRAARRFRGSVFRGRPGARRARRCLRNRRCSARHRSG